MLNVASVPPIGIEDGSPVAVVGGGLMGHAICAVLVRGGYDVTCVEPDPRARESFDWRVLAALDALGDKTAQTAAGRSTTVPDTGALRPDIRLVIEAAPENLTLKQALFVELARACPDAVLATNTSVYRVDDVGSDLDDRSRLVGTHWWNPPHLMPLVEVVRGTDSAPGIVDEIVRILRRLDKVPVIVGKDTPGFIGNRLQHALWREAMSLIDEGVCGAEDVDLVARNSIGLRLSALGPLENADFVGLDLTRSIHEYLFPALSRAERPVEVLERLVDSGELGAKTGRGFYEWADGQRDETAARLAERVRLLVASNASSTSGALVEAAEAGGP